MMRTIISAALLLACLQFARAAPATQDHYQIGLLPGSDGLLVSETRYLEDSQHVYTPQLFFVQLLANTVNTYTAMPFDKGRVNNRYLLGFSVRNNRGQAAALRLLTGIPRSHYLHVYLFDENGNRHSLLQDDAQTPFGKRGNACRLLNTRAFSLPARQSAVIVMEYETRGASYLPVMLGTDNAVAQWLDIDAMFSWLFYLSAGLAILLLAWRGALLKHAALLQLTALLAFGLLTVSASDGVAFHALWPAAPQWNAQAEILLQYLLAAAGLLLAWRMTARTDSHGVARLLMLALATSALLLAAGANRLDNIMLWNGAYALAAIMPMALLYALASRFPGNPGCSNLLYFSALAAIVAAVAALLYLHHALPPGFVLMHATRIAYLAAMLAIALPAAVCLRKAED